MDQIFIDALVDSRKYAPVQYVLCKGIERRRISGDNRVMLLHMLKHGWDIAAKFNNGSDEEDYRITAPADIALLIAIVLNLSLRKADTSVIYSTVFVSFQHFYTADTNAEDGTKCWLNFYSKDKDDKPLYDTVYLDADCMEEVRDTISVLKAHGLRRDKEMLMHILKVDIEKANKCSDRA